MDNKYLQFKAGGRRGYPEYNGSVITKREGLLLPTRYAMAVLNCERVLQGGVTVFVRVGIRRGG